MPAVLIERSHEPIYYRRVRGKHVSERSSALTLTICSALAALGGLGGAVLAIIGLGSGALFDLTAVAAIAIGGGLVVHGLGATARTAHSFQRAGDRTDRIGLVSGVSAEVLGGGAAVVLGIAALGGVLPFVLPAVAAIVLGSAVLLAAIAQRSLAQLGLPPVRKLHRVAYHATTSGAWLLALGGTGAIVLGILELLGFGPVFVLTAAAMIAVGGAQFVAGAALATRFGAQLDEYPAAVSESSEEREVVRYDRARLLDLLTARLTAGRTGSRLYDAIVSKLRAEPASDALPLVSTLETYAGEERDNEQWLEEQIHALGGDVHELTDMAELETRESSGIEDVVVASSVRDPLHLLHALHAAELSDAAGWRLLVHVADEVGDREMKHDAERRYEDKQAHLRFLDRALERLARQIVVREPVEMPLTS